MADQGNDLALRRADARVHRCGDCGSWRYGKKPCATCVAADQLRPEAS